MKENVAPIPQRLCLTPQAKINKVKDEVKAMLDVGVNNSLWSSHM